MVDLPNTMPGHWDSAAGAEIAREYAGMSRSQLCGGDLTDSNVAFRTAMLGRNQLDHEAVLTVAKDRIRWLSVQLAIANFGNADLLVALGEWKCPACGGSGGYHQNRAGTERMVEQGRPLDPHFNPGRVDCKKCGGSGLHPIASAAIAKAKGGK